MQIPLIVALIRVSSDESRLNHGVEKPCDAAILYLNFLVKSIRVDIEVVTDDHCLERDVSHPIIAFLFIVIAYFPARVRCQVSQILIQSGLFSYFAVIDNHHEVCGVQVRLIQCIAQDLDILNIGTHPS